MQEMKVRLGIIGANTGYGWGPRAHLPALKGLPEYELTAVCTEHQETAEASKAKYGARLAYTDYKEMLRNPEVEAVTVNVRVPKHLIITRDALNAGKHVYTEWPLGANLKETEDLAALAKAKGVRTMIGLQGRASPQFLRIKELIAEGYVGEVLTCHLVQLSQSGLERPSSAMWSVYKQAGVNSLTIAMPHTVDAFCMAVGEFTELSAMVATQMKQLTETDTKTKVTATAPDTVMLTGKLVNGALVSVYVGNVPHTRDAGMRLEIYGRDGMILATSPGNAQLSEVTLQGSKRGFTTLETFPMPDHLTWVPKDMSPGPHYNVAQMYRLFAESIRTSKRIEPDFETALSRHRWVDAIQRASDTGQRQSV